VHLLNRVFLVLDIEDEILGGFNAPLQHDIEVDDVAVGGQHQAFLGQVALAAFAGAVIGFGEADIHRAQFVDLDGFRRFDRRGEVIAEAFLVGGARPGAEALDDHVVAGIDDEKAAGQPQGNHGE
jgi:hypothetical protein